MSRSVVGLVFLALLVFGAFSCKETAGSDVCDEPADDCEALHNQDDPDNQKSQNDDPHCEEGYVEVDGACEPESHCDVMEPSDDCYCDDGDAQRLCPEGYLCAEGICSPPWQFSYDSGCLAVPDRLLLEDFGTITFGVDADGAERGANADAILAAIEAAPVGGTVCLPEGQIYLTHGARWEEAGKPAGWGQISFWRGDFTLWGAGACGWGELAGCTYIGTPGDSEFGEQYYSWSDDDRVLRGSGIRNMIPPSQPWENVTFRGFELDGHAPHTGCYNWHTEAYNCWDIFQKGIDFGGGPRMDNVLLEDIKLHRFRGEMIYAGGGDVDGITARRIWVSNSNASAWNVTAQQGLIEDSHLGPTVRFWGEFENETNEFDMLFRNNLFEHYEITHGGFAIAQGTERLGRFEWQHNEFHAEGHQTLFLLAEGNFDFEFHENLVHGGLRLFMSQASGPSNPNLQPWREPTRINIRDNLFHGLRAPMYIQNGQWAGFIADNQFFSVDESSTAPYGASNGQAALVTIERNFFENPAPATWDGSPQGPISAPLIRDSTFASAYDGPSMNVNDNTVRIRHERIQLNPLSSMAEGVFQSNSQAKTSYADGQVVRVYNRHDTRSAVFPASESVHNWGEDLVVGPQETVYIQYSRDTFQWNLSPSP